MAGPFTKLVGHCSIYIYYVNSMNHLLNRVYATIDRSSNQCYLVIYISDIILKYTTISYFMYNVSFFLNKGDSLCDAAWYGELDVIKSAIKYGSVHVNAIDEVSICHTYISYCLIHIV